MYDRVTTLISDDIGRLVMKSGIRFDLLYWKELRCNKSESVRNGQSDDGTIDWFRIPSSLY